MMSFEEVWINFVPSIVTKTTNYTYPNKDEEIPN
jgi:hypothetical protein